MACYEHLQQKAREAVNESDAEFCSIHAEVAAESIDEARYALFGAAIYALAIRAPEALDLLEALSEQIDLTVKIHEAGLLPEGVILSRDGDRPLAFDWLERNINTLLAQRNAHPAIREWARLNDMRHLIAHRLPRLN